MPFEGRFFEMFNEHGTLIEQGSRELAGLITTFDNLEQRVLNIETIEKKGDRITRNTMELLHKTFIPPLERDDIHQLITCMDDILDLLEDAAQSISIYNVREMTPEAGQLVQVCVACAEKVKQAVAMLSNMDNAQSIMAVCADIDRLESEADHVYRAAMAKLFRDEPDVRQVIRLRTVYELLEAMTDRCEDAANIMEGMVLESA
jgi:hypothetical protein